MAVPVNKVSVAQSLAGISAVLITSFALAVLYFGRDLLVPVALALLLTFLLAPLVTKLQRHIGRVGAVVMVVVVLFCSTLAAGWVLTRQAVGFVEQLPDYKDNIKTKIQAVQSSGGMAISKFTRTINELKDDLPEEPSSVAAKESPESSEPKPIPVEVIGGNQQKLRFAQRVAAAVLGPLGTTALVFLLLVFMLLEREELRNRMIRLIGQGHLTETTNALDDAGARISRYLLMLLVVNVTYGIPLGIGLYFIGVPNAVLWGALAIVLRFIPYVGPWIGGLFPILTSFATLPGWTGPLLTISLIVVLELVSNNLVEPWLYGTSTGVTPVALIIAALAWTSLWGPVGLLLSTPLTVCLVVMGRHIPRLSFLSILLSDENALTPSEDCYQRLLSSGDHDETEMMTSFLKSHAPQNLFDQVLVPALITAGTDYRAGLLDPEQLEAVEEGVRNMLDESRDIFELDSKDPPPSAPAIVCLAARTKRDDLAGTMLGQLLHLHDFRILNTADSTISLDNLRGPGLLRAKVAVISVVPPSAPLHARRICSKLRSSLPDIHIMVGLWGRSEKPIETLRILQDAGADDVVTTMAEALEHIIRLCEAANPESAPAESAS